MAYTLPYNEKIKLREINQITTFGVQTNGVKLQPDIEEQIDGIFKIIFLVKLNDSHHHVLPSASNLMEWMSTWITNEIGTKLTITSLETCKKPIDFTTDIFIKYTLENPELANLTGLIE